MCIHSYIDPGDKSWKSITKRAAARVFSSYASVRHRVLTKNTQEEKYDDSVNSKLEFPSVHIWSTHAVLSCAEKSTPDAQRFVASNTAYVYHHECTPVLQFLP